MTDSERDIDLSPGSPDIVEIPSELLVDANGEPISIVDALRAAELETSGTYFNGGSTPLIPHLGLTDEEGIEFMSGLAGVVEQMRADTQ